ncbi:hypothetical protein [Modestobacter sp. KNN46-3]|uniref:hypothetical protein n=1 Tax=Modestobacter sp. KNN46-3 TaxID=2711218 RepID=UPI0013DF57E3|nr:hypothetical protein [Modestobacter sp. KNN46-3]
MNKPLLPSQPLIDPATEMACIAKVAQGAVNRRLGVSGGHVTAAATPEGWHVTTTSGGNTVAALIELRRQGFDADLHPDTGVIVRAW